MKLILLFGLLPKELEEEIINNTKGTVQNAANALQWAIIDGIEQNVHNGIDVQILNSMYIDSFPKGYKYPIIKTTKFKHFGVNDINVGFINVVGLSSLFRALSLRKYIRKILKNKSEKTVFLFYALTSPFVLSARYIKRLSPDVVTCAITPDLPQYMNTSSNRRLLRRLMISLETYLVNKNLKYIDSYVLLTKYMREKLNTQNYIVMEGIAPNGIVFGNSEQDSGEKIILYGGTLHKKYGILTLLEAFLKIEGSEYRLHIYGDGDSRNEVEVHAILDKRIKYFGLVKRNKLYDAISRATVLVNPRQNDEEFTKYSFPSKTMECLVSGIPYVGYKLDGIPDVYYKYMFCPDDNSADALSNTLKLVCELDADERRFRGQSARNFVLMEKNAQKQAYRILDFVYGDNDG